MSASDSPATAPRALFWSYDPGLPSFRHRLAPAIDLLRRRGWRCEVEPLPRGRYVRRIVERRQHLAAADLVVLAKLNLALGEAGLLRRAARRLVLDFDDAIWVKKPRRLHQEPGRSWLRWRKFAGTCRAADLVVAGNDFLAATSRRAGARVAETVPTSVDTARYAPLPAGERDRQTLVWIGLPENLFYLELVRPALAKLAVRFPALRLRVVSSAFPDWPKIPVERVPWSAATEPAALGSAGIGLMPLTDDPWSRGKCAFKLCQYMAAGLPCVASPVGANREVVVPGETGALARGDEEWEAAIGGLLADPERAERYGRAGRRRAEELYDRKHVAERTAGLYSRLLDRSAE